MPTLDRITIYPVKSLDGVDVAAARVLAAGGLEYDRRWQLTDLEGRVVNAKRTPLFHVIRAEFDLALECRASGVTRLGANVIHLTIDPTAVAARAIPGIERLSSLGPESFPIVPGPQGPCGWLAEAYGQEVLLVERSCGGFPDDRDSPGPTLVSTASIVEAARWFRLDLAECRRRFRANLEIGGCEAFWEDALASPARPELRPPPSALEADLPADPYASLPPPEPRTFTIGEASFRATDGCRRCVVPSRDSRTGAVTTHFREVFEAWRRRTLRLDVEAGSWHTLYRLGTKTQVTAAGPLARGDRVIVTPDASFHTQNGIAASSSARSANHGGGSGTWRAGL